MTAELERNRGVGVSSGQNEECEDYGRGATAVMTAVKEANFILERER